MTVRFTLEHIFPVSVDVFWDKVFTNKTFNTALYEQELGFRYELEFWEKDRRRARIWPVAEVPRTISAVLGDRITLCEEGTFDQSRLRYDFTVVVPALGNRVKTIGSERLQPQGPDQCAKIIEIEINVSMFGVGGAIERFVEASTRDQYDRSARFAAESLQRV